MSSVIVTQMIALLANMILESGTFDRVVGVVQRWHDKEISNVEKREGVLKEFEIIGLNLTGWFANVAIELAVGYVKYGAGTGDKPNVESTIEKDLGK